MLSHPILASEDDKEFVERAILNLPLILREFFECLEAVYIDAKSNEYQTRANVLYRNAQRQLRILCHVPKKSFHGIVRRKNSNVIDEELPKLLNCLSALLLEDVIALGPQALSWKKLCLQIAEDCAYHMRDAHMVYQGNAKGLTGTLQVVQHKTNTDNSAFQKQNELTNSFLITKEHKMKKGYYTISYGDTTGYIDGKQLDEQVVMIAFDENFFITRWNTAAEVLTGFLEDGCIGKPLSELVQCPNGANVCEEIRRTQMHNLIKIKLCALAMNPTTLYTVVAPILNSQCDQVGNILICANAKDNLHQYRNYICDYIAGEACGTLTLLSQRRSLSPQDATMINILYNFARNGYTNRVMELAHEMATDWEWTNVGQLIGRALGATLNQHEVIVDPLFPSTLCISPYVAKAIGIVTAFPKGRCMVNLQVCNLSGNIFSLNVVTSICSKETTWDQDFLEESLRPLMKTIAGNIYYSKRRIELHFPCQVAAILEDTEDALQTDLAKQLAQARTTINCTVNVVALIKNICDQHNLSLILLKTMFVTLANVQERVDLERRLSARPCDVDVVICDSEWLSSSRDILLGGDHGAIIIPLLDSTTVLYQSFEFVIRMPMIGHDFLQMMLEVGKRVSVKKNATTALEERERILTLRQDSPWTKGRLLGRGSYGAVYEATNDLTGGKMAVKMFYFSANCENSINQLLNEIKIMCSLNHPNIVHYFHCERKDNNVSLFMELCEASLTDVIVGRTKKILNLSVLNIIRQVLTAIAYLHSRGIAHRDIKPQNILIKGDTIKLTDFGTAQQGNASKEVRGTFRYMAPEVYKGQPHSLPCDIWSIGCLACELFACPPKFMENNSLLGEMTSSSAYLEDVPRNALFCDFLYRCFKLDSTKRDTSHDLLLHPLLSASTFSEELENMHTIFDKNLRGDIKGTEEECAFSILSTELPP